MRIRIRQTDKLFSQYIRQRDRACRRCRSLVQFDADGIPKSHECSHFWGRGKESTRFDEENCDTMCMGCHRYFTAHPAEYREWKLKQMGERRYNALMVRAHTIQKKDDKLQSIRIREMLKRSKGEGGDRD